MIRFDMIACLVLIYFLAGGLSLIGTHRDRDTDRMVTAKIFFWPLVTSLYIVCGVIKLLVFLLSGLWDIIKDTFRTKQEPPKDTDVFTNVTIKKG